MPITESDLPGVGKNFEIDLNDEEMGLVIHNTGEREVFRRSGPDEDSEKVFEFSDEMARKIGSIIEGAHFRPIESETAETTLPGGILLEWYEIQPGSALIDETLESADIGNRSGFTPFHRVVRTSFRPCHHRRCVSAREAPTVRQ